MQNEKNVLCLDIRGVTVERIPLTKYSDINFLKEGLINTYSLFRGMYYEIYYYRESEKFNSVESDKVEVCNYENQRCCFSEKGRKMWQRKSGREGTIIKEKRGNKDHLIILWDGVGSTQSYHKDFIEVL